MSDTRKSNDPKLIVATILLLVVVVVAITLKTIGAVSISNDSVYVDTGKSKIMDVENVVSASGTLEGVNIARVLHPVHEIREILVEEMDEVTEGQVIAALNVSDLDEQHQKAEAALETSEFRYKAAKVLYEEGAISELMFKEAESVYNNDLISLNSSNTEEAGIIRSPITGTVIKINNDQGPISSENAADPLFIIEDLSALRMIVFIGEYDIGQIKEGQEVIISAGVLGDAKAQGVVSRIGSVGERMSSRSDAVVPVYIDVTEEDRLIAGITGKADIVIQKIEGALVAPNEAIFNDHITKAPSCFKLGRDNKLKLVHLKTGITGQLYTQILDSDGLQAGDRIVMSPAPGLSDGLPVYAAPE
ncbi:pyoverdine biosynthesis protein PvdR [Clostridia bacterium]|nr:pyoverdine biosynthesis protein PvdR [Clostridia bacterium]